MIDQKLTVKVDAFNAVLKDMSQRLERHTTPQKIIESEVAKVLEKALAETDAATVSTIRNNFQAQEWTMLDGKRYALHWRLPNGLWRRLSASRKRNLQRRLAARGLAKRSFHALGLTFGFDIKAPAFVKGAVTRGHTSAQNVASQSKSTADTFGLRIENHSPLLRYTGARRAFFAAVAGRVSYFTKNLAKGVFDDLKQVTAKYPGIRFGP